FCVITCLFYLLLLSRLPRSTLFPYTTLFRSSLTTLKPPFSSATRKRINISLIGHNRRISSVDLVRRVRELLIQQISSTGRTTASVENMPHQSGTPIPRNLTHYKRLPQLLNMLRHLRVLTPRPRRYRSITRRFHPKPAAKISLPLRNLASPARRIRIEAKNIKFLKSLTNNRVNLSRIRRPVLRIRIRTLPHLDSEKMLRIHTHPHKCSSVRLAPSTTLRAIEAQDNPFTIRNNNSRISRPHKQIGRATCRERE